MTSSVKSIAKKYSSMMEKKSLHDSDGKVKELSIPTASAKAILIKALEEYEQMNSHPREDFWGQPI